MAGPSARTPIAADARLEELEFVAFDTETTGCASATGRMVELGAVRFRLDGTGLDRFTRLVNPLRPIPATVTAIHGITDAMVRDCPAEAEVLPEFLAFLGDPRRTVLMAHNARFDMAFVGSALARCGMPAPPHVVIDTVRLSRRRAKGLPSHSLRSLVRCFRIGETTEHRGLSDSIALKQVFLNLVARPPALETAGDLFALVPAWRLTAEVSHFRRQPEESCRERRSVGPSLGVGRFAAGALFHGPFAAEVTGETVLGTEVSAGESGGTEPCGDEPARLAEAIAAGRTVTLVYDGGRTAGQRRSLTPLRLVVSAEVTYLLAFCHADRKQKQFRVDRIRELVIE
ncbi:MAG TPA: exonuclease domain-containing protein [Planctomycetaceae bacterium]